MAADRAQNGAIATRGEESRVSNARAQQRSLQLRTAETRTIATAPQSNVDPSGDVDAATVTKPARANVRYQDLEDAHKIAAGATGRLALALTVRRIRPSDLTEMAQELKRAATILVGG